MRVLMLATTVPARRGDGTPSFVLDGACALGEDVEVLLLAPRTAVAPRRSRVGRVEVQRFAYSLRRWEHLGDGAIMPQLQRRPSRWVQAVALSLAMACSAVRAHRAMRPDVVHAHWIVPAGAVALMLRVCFGTPYLVTAHGADAYTLERGPIRALKRAVVTRASRFIAVSSEILARFDRRPDGASVQPVGVDVHLWEHLVGPRDPQDRTVLYVGRLAPKKGLGTALEAIAALPSAQLRVVGDGPERAALERQVADLGISDRVTFLGTASREQVAAELRVATCIVIPSVIAADGDRDGTPAVLGEAVAAGVPVIASDLGGLGEHLDQNSSGILVPPGDAAALRVAIDRLLHDRDARERLAREARRSVLPRLSLDDAAARHRAWYAEAVASG